MNTTGHVTEKLTLFYFTLGVIYRFSINIMIELYFVGIRVSQDSHVTRAFVQMQTKRCQKP